MTNRGVNETSRGTRERPDAATGETDAAEGVRVSAPRKLLHRVMWAVLGMFGPMISCRELNGFLARYVEGGLTPDEKRAFERHLAMCRPCRAYVESYRRTLELERYAFAEPDALVPDEVPEELVRAVLAARRAAG